MKEVRRVVRQSTALKIAGSERELAEVFKIRHSNNTGGMPSFFVALCTGAHLKREKLKSGKFRWLVIGSENETDELFLLLKRGETGLLRYQRLNYSQKKPDLFLGLIPGPRASQKPQSK